MDHHPGAGQFQVCAGYGFTPGIHHASGDLGPGQHASFEGDRASRSGMKRVNILPTGSQPMVSGLIAVRVIALSDFVKAKMSAGIGDGVVNCRSLAQQFGLDARYAGARGPIDYRAFHRLRAGAAGAKHQETAKLPHNRWAIEDGTELQDARKG